MKLTRYCKNRITLHFIHIKLIDFLIVLANTKFFIQNDLRYERTVKLL